MLNSSQPLEASPLRHTVRQKSMSCRERLSISKTMWWSWPPHGPRVPDGAAFAIFYVMYTIISGRSASSTVKTISVATRQDLKNKTQLCPGLAFQSRIFLFANRLYDVSFQPFIQNEKWSPRWCDKTSSSHFFFLSCGIFITLSFCIWACSSYKPRCWH